MTWVVLSTLFAVVGLTSLLIARANRKTETSPGNEEKTILLDSRVLQDFKEVTSQYTAAEITTKREQLRQDTKKRLTAELQPYSIKVVDFFVKNLDYSQAYKQAVSDKNVQQQKSLQAQAEVSQSEAEARQEVAKAQGDARATVVRANADATALAKKGTAIRKNPEVLQL